MAMKSNGGGVHEFHSISIKDAPGSLQMLASDDDEAPVLAQAAAEHAAANGESSPVTVGEGVSVLNSGRIDQPSTKSAYVYGRNPWWVVGFNLIGASDSSYVLGYPFLIMAHLGWIAGPIILSLLIVVSVYNNCLLGSLHETGGKRRNRTRDLAGYIYGPGMYKAVWVLQYTILFIFCIGTFIWSGTSLQAIYVTYAKNPLDIGLSVWIAIAGLCYSFIAFFVPTLNSLGRYSGFSLFLTMMITFIAIGISVKDGLRSEVRRDYSLLGTNADKWFNAMGSLSIVGFAFNTAILPELQAGVKPPTVRNIYKALAMQYTIGAIPVVTLTIVGYWAYGNTVSQYMFYSSSGPEWLITVANVAACLQIIVTIHIYALPMYEFLDSTVLKARTKLGWVKDSAHQGNNGAAAAAEGDWSARKMLRRFLTRQTYICLTTLLAAMFPFFGDFLELGGAFIIFPLNFGLVHHMYLKVKGKNFRWYQRTWHWSLIVTSILLTAASAIASVRNIISSAATYHVFKSNS